MSSGEEGASSAALFRNEYDRYVVLDDRQCYGMRGLPGGAGRGAGGAAAAGGRGVGRGVKGAAAGGRGVGSGAGGAAAMKNQNKKTIQ